MKIIDRKSVIPIRILIYFFYIVIVTSINNKAYSEFFTPSKVTSSSPQTIEQAQSQAYGSKPTIAVIDFDNKTGVIGGGGFGGGKASIGSGMKEQLVTALAQTNAFIIVERQAIKDVLGEQDFGASGRVKGNTASQMGEIEGANFLIYGAVTEFEGGQAKGGAGVGSRLIPAIIGGFFSQDHVAIEIRIVDSRTSRVVNATAVEGKAKDLGGGFGGMFGQTLLGVAGQYKTPIQKAVRACMIKAVNWIADNLIDKTASAGTAVINPVSTQSQEHSYSDDDIEQRLIRLKRLVDKGLITDEEYKERKTEILEGL